MNTKQERLESAASDIGFDDAGELETLLGMNSLCVFTKEERGEFERLNATLNESLALLERIVKYAQEDKARTPWTTRLERAVSEAAAVLKAHTGAPAADTEE